MITRAIGLMIIVGDHETLIQDMYWSNLIEYISDNDGLFREDKKIKLKRPIECPIPSPKP